MQQGKCLPLPCKHFAGKGYKHFSRNIMNSKVKNAENNHKGYKHVYNF